jgi:hypothetical protein
VSALLRDARTRVEFWTGMARRTAPAPVIARSVVAVLALAGFLLVLPEHLLGSWYVAGLVAAALLPAIAPRSWVVTAVILVTALGWVAVSLVYDNAASVLRLMLLTAVLYLLHSAAAFAAVLPYDAIVVPSVVLGWLARALAVALGSAGLGVFAMRGSAAIADHSYLFASIVGLAVAGCLVWLLARLR